MIQITNTMARTINTNSQFGMITIVTNDIISPAFGNNYIVATQPSSAVNSPQKMTLKYGEVAISLPFIKPTKFSLEWLKYYAPKNGTQEVNIEVYADDTILATIPYLLTAGHEEIEVNGKTFYTGSDEKYFSDDIAVICPTQQTEHWRECEILIKKTPDKIAVESGVSGDLFMVADIAMTDIGIHTINTERNLNMYVDVLNETQQTKSYNIARYNIKPASCYSIELRVTNRHGLRGVICGKIADASEGGDDIQSTFNKTIPYAGVSDWSKKGATIKKEVTFNFEGDADLLGLLRDACVYGNAEWYDERTSQWLPCKIEDKSASLDAWKEQSITIVLQQQ